MITRRRFLKISAATAGLGAGLGFYTWRWEPHWIETMERNLSLLNLPPYLAGKRLVQLSDLHIGSLVEDTYLIRVFDRVKSLSPDLVVYTGDFDPGKAFAQLKPQKAALVLSHNPDTVDLPGWEKYQGWILCGHTHGGQCKPPFLPPPLLPVQNRRYIAGRYELSGNRRMYINRGVGHILPVRFNVRPEITAFQLERMTEV